MKLNGWQRIWVILAVLWLLFVILRLLNWAFYYGFAPDKDAWELIILALFAPFGVYILVLLARRLTLWVIKGFRGA